MLLDGDGALYWPEQGILILSDLHLEKSTFLAQQGSFIAPYDTQDTLERLERVITLYQPRELVLLGDSFHDRKAWTRLDASLRDRLLSLVSRVDRCHWIEGNHDREAVCDLPPFTANYACEGVLLAHEHTSSSLPHIIGHYHPKMRIMLQKRVVRGKCFVRTPDLLIMPAFGTFTGGLDIHHPAFQKLIASKEIDYFLLYKSSIYRVRAPAN